MHTILGAGGVIGRGLAEVLIRSGQRVRLVSRRAEPHPAAEVWRADLTDAAQTRAAVQGSRVVYLVVGLPYRTAVWQRDWPRVMEAVVAACAETGARLVFFDNVYAYGRVTEPMTEHTPFHPCSRKGEVRARVAARLLQAMQTGEVTALIARAPDFYGPGCRNSLLNLMVVEKLVAGTKAWWPVNDTVPHAFIYTPDAARATALLGQSETAWGQTWLLPTAAPAPTGREMVAMAAAAVPGPARHAVLGRGLFHLAGWFNADARESRELLYQHEFPYQIDSTRFETAFAFTPTPYAEGIRQTVLAARGRP